MDPCFQEICAWCCDKHLDTFQLDRTFLWLVFGKHLDKLTFQLCHIESWLVFWSDTLKFAECSSLLPYSLTWTSVSSVNGSHVCGGEHCQNANQGLSNTYILVRPNTLFLVKLKLVYLTLSGQIDKLST